MTPKISSPQQIRKLRHADAYVANDRFMKPMRVRDTHDQVRTMRVQLDDQNPTEFRYAQLPNCCVHILPLCIMDEQTSLQICTCLRIQPDMHCAYRYEFVVLSLHPAFDEDYIKRKLEMYATEQVDVHSAYMLDDED
jgi:hypothetical protein